MSASVWNPGLPSNPSFTFTAAQLSALTGTITNNVANLLTGMLFLKGKIAFTSAGVGGSPIELTCTLPYAFPLTPLGLTVGTFNLQRAAGTRYVGAVTINGANKLAFVLTGTVGAAVVGVDPAFAIASGDTLVFSATIPLA